MSSGTDVSVLVVNYNTAHLLDDMFGRLSAASVGFRLRRVVVDNASRDGSLTLLRERFPDVELIVNEVNVGFGRANNQGLEKVAGEFVLLLNTDAFVAPDTLEKTLTYMRAHPECGVLGVRLIGRDGELQPSCRYFPTVANLFISRAGLERFFPGVRRVDDMSWDHASVRECDWVPGCYYLIRRAVIDRVGLFDPRYFLYYEEVDHCRAVKAAGWKVVYFADTTVIHIGGESAKSDSALTAAGRQISVLQIESELLYFRKHHGLAGVWGIVLTGLLVDLILACKWLLRRRGFSGLAVYVKHSAAVLRGLRRTRWGTVATR